MRGTLILFVRAPQLGTGKRRLARDIGDIAALCFERVMIALLLRRLAKDRRWRLRIAVTPDRDCRRARHWRPSLETVGQGSGDLGVRMDLQEHPGAGEPPDRLDRLDRQPGRAHGWRRRISPAATAIPTASTPTSTGVPCRPCTNVWCSSSVAA